MDVLTIHRFLNSVELNGRLFQTERLKPTSHPLIVYPFLAHFSFSFIKNSAKMRAASSTLRAQGRVL
jgi:hypothetical protein